MSEYATEPLSETALAELDEFLLSDACSDGTLAIDEAHGFLTAMVVVGGQPDVTDFAPAVWGEPDFADEGQRERMTALLGAVVGEIASSLSSRRDFEPLVIETEEEGELVESYEGWCFGFMVAVEQNPDAWQALPKESQGLLAPMAQLALQDSDEETPMTEEEYLQWVELIPGAVMGLYSFWHSP